MQRDHATADIHAPLATLVLVAPEGLFDMPAAGAAPAVPGVPATARRARRSPVLMTTGRDGRVTAIDPGWRRALGWELDEVEGRPLASFVHADDQERVTRGLATVSQGAGPVTLDVRWRRARDGFLRLRGRLALRHGSRGTLAGLQAGAATLSSRDIDEQARRQSLRSIARLAGGLSHEFNNLFQVLRNTLELIAQRPDAAREVAERAVAGLRMVDRGSQLTSQLLAFAGRQGLLPQTVRVGDVLVHLRDRLERVLAPSGTLRLELPGDPVLASGDAAQLERALLNLALNATDAMPGGGPLTIRVGRAHVADDRELGSGDYVTIDVHDGGAGMSERVRERAFEPFFTTKAPGRGSGLGLSQVYGFVHEIGGAVRIMAPDTPDAPGITVRLWLPAVANGGTAPLDERDAATTPWSDGLQPLVLIVCDDHRQRERLLAAVQLLGHAPVHTADASTASQRITLLHPDLVILALPPLPSGPDGLAHQARLLRPGAGIVQLGDPGTGAEDPLDLEAFASAIWRAVALAQP